MQQILKPKHICKNHWQKKQMNFKNHQKSGGGEVHLVQPWPELLLMSEVQVIFGKLNIAWGRGDKRNALLKQHCKPFLRGGFRVYLMKCIFFINFRNCPMMF